MRAIEELYKDGFRPAYYIANEIWEALELEEMEDLTIENLDLKISEKDAKGEIAIFEGEEHVIFLAR
ncbi:MAG: hypothetical protein NTU85_02300 [Candidatus Kaiserbacteria bacterium]|nr:hypothetical protein [Candidatus Kaiserbacteria bacterium]